MATLADLFNEKQGEQDTIYNRYQPSENQLVVIKPDSDNISDSIGGVRRLGNRLGVRTLGGNSRIADDDRALPVVSTLRDVERVTKFLRSSDGTLFLAKQGLLQLGNTFENTRLYNPLSPLISAGSARVVRIRRDIQIPKSITNVPSGLLQTTTVAEGASSILRKGQSGTGVALLAFGKAQLRGIVRIATSQLTAQKYFESRPEYGVFGINAQGKYNTTGKRPATGPILFSGQPLSERGSRKIISPSSVSSIGQGIARDVRGIFGGSDSDKVLSFLTAANTFKENFAVRNVEDVFVTNIRVDRFRSSYLTENFPGGKTSGTDQFLSVNKKELNTGLRDPYNLLDPYRINDLPVDATVTRGITPLAPSLTGESQEKPDIIGFSFSTIGTVGNATQNIKFRALVSSIKESVKPEFNEQRYVGRTERFVTYGGAKRTVNLTFNIVAFSKDEIDGMWGRINFLTGLAFPSGVSTSGFMIPPLFKINLGGIYTEQPCYIESLDYDFLDETITFDIDKEVPFAINVTMQLSLLEKRSRFHNSPFYKITENIANRQSATAAAADAAQRKAAAEAEAAQRRLAALDAYERELAEDTDRRQLDLQTRILQRGSGVNLATRARESLANSAQTRPPRRLVRTPTDRTSEYNFVNNTP